MLGGGGGGSGVFLVCEKMLIESPPSLFSQLIAHSLFSLIRTDRESLEQANNLYRSSEVAIGNRVATLRCTIS